GRVEVADLRAGDVDRMAIRGALAGEDERVAHALLPRLRGRAGALHPEPDASDVRDHVARLARVVAIVERGRRGDRRLGVLLFAQVVPDTAALGRTEGDLELGEQLRPACLVAAADAVLAGEHRGRGDRVVALPRRIARLRGLQVRVQAGGVGVDLLEQFLASRAAKECVLAGQLGVGLRARDELARL